MFTCYNPVLRCSDAVSLHFNSENEHDHQALTLKIIRLENLSPILTAAGYVHDATTS
jgi:hypothetical protein